MNPKLAKRESPYRLLPAGAVAGWGFHPLEKRRLCTAHANSRHWRGKVEGRKLAYCVEKLDTGAIHEVFRDRFTLDRCS
jgi:hypothetical protein